MRNDLTMIPTRIRLGAASFLIGASLSAMTACDSAISFDKELPVAHAATETGATVMPETVRNLTIYGYNYTNRYIDSFEVDGQGGGNLDVSGPGSGGGGSVCCYGWRMGAPLPQTFRVRWASSGCLKTLTSSSGYKHQVVEHQFTERDVLIEGPVPLAPSFLEVHIYPDQHVEIALTSDYSSPRLKLNPERQVREYPQCKEAS